MRRDYNYQESTLLVHEQFVNQHWSLEILYVDHVSFPAKTVSRGRWTNCKNHSLWPESGVSCREQPLGRWSHLRGFQVVDEKALAVASLLAV